MRCLLGHKWKWHTSVQVNYWRPGRDMPSRTETEVSGHCVRCGEPRMKTMAGHWEEPS